MLKFVPRIISALVGLALVGGGLYLIISGHEAQGAGLVTGGLGTLALPRLAEGPTK